MKHAFPTALTVAVVLAGIVLLRSRFATPSIPEPETPEANGTSTLEGLESQEITPGPETPPSHENVDTAPGSRSAVEAEVVEPAPPAPGMTRIIARDTEGNPVANAMVVVMGNREANAASKQGGSSPITMTNEQGILDLELGTVGGYYVWILPEDHIPIVEDEEQARHAAPGGPPWVFEFKRPAQTRFLVLDDQTSEPIETFGVYFGRRTVGSMSIEHEAIHEPAVHPKGEFVVSAEPGVDNYTVFAEGYHAAGGRVSHVAPDDPTQVVRLKLIPEIPEGTLVRGRLLEGGKPIEGAEVMIVGGYFGPIRTENERSVMLGAWDDRGSRFEPESYDGTPKPTDADGRFLAGARYSGAYRVTFEREGKPPLFSEVIHIDEGMESVDLGDIEWTRDASIEGQVILPAGVDPSDVGIVVDRGEGTEATTGSLDQNAEFRVDGLESGTTRVWVAPIRRVFGASEPRTLELSSASVARVTLDVRNRVACKVHLSLPFPELEEDRVVRAYLHAFEPRAVVHPFWNRGVGHWEVDSVPTPAALVEFEFGGYPHGQRSVVHSDPFELPPGGTLEIERRFQFGALDLELPANLPVEADGELVLILTRPTDRVRPEPARDRHTMKAPIDASGLASWEFVSWSMSFPSTDARAAHWRVDLLQPGDYKVVLRVFGAPGDKNRRPTLASLDGRASVEANRRTSARLR